MSDVDRERYDGIRLDVKKWLEDERVFYASRKWPPEAMLANLRALTGDPKCPNEQWQFAFNYMGRSIVLGEQTPAGRQAVGKLILTLICLLECAVYEHGPMPTAGYPSGEIVT